MDRQPVSSGHITSIGWEDGVLEVEFKNGAVYQYPDISQAEFEALCVAPSVGKFLHQNIKLKGGHERVG